MPAQRDEPSAPPQAENDLRQGIVVALLATGRLVPAFQRGMNLPYGTGLNCYVQAQQPTKFKKNLLAISPLIGYNL